MCGIAGILSPCRERRQAIRPLTEALHHRGPDGSGYFGDGQIALGHRRLAIVDLEGGRQPMTDESGRLQLVCNGEIYNSPELRRELERRGHRFATRCDVEVILHLYEEEGVECVRRLRGMFAFALWDPDARRLLLARDPSGQKPLHYLRRGETFAFASEIHAFFEAGLLEPEIDLEGLWHFTSLRFVPEPRTLFAGIEKLPAAHRLVLEHGELRIERYWDVDFRHKREGSDEELLEELHRVLRETVELHLLSDVRVGAFVSGGIDSSLVAALMQSLSPAPVPAFSIGVFEDSYNELPFARQVTDHCGMEAHARRVEARVVELLPEMIQSLGEPVDPFALGVYLVSDLAAEHVKVVLGGDGGDETFAGYDRFAGQKLAEYYALLPAAVRRGLCARLLARIPNSFNYKSLAQKLAWLHHMSFFDEAGRYAESMMFLRFHEAIKQRLFTPAAKARIADPDSAEKLLRFYRSERAEEFVDRMLYTELHTRMPEHNLLVADRMSMIHSLELRSPLIDHEFVQFAASLPGRLKLRGTRIKYGLRKVAERYLPAALAWRDKQGFGFPVGKWMRGEFAGMVQALFRDSRLVALGIFDPACLEALRREHLEGRFEHSFRLWMLVNLEIWYRLFFERETVERTRAQLQRLAAAPAAA